MICGKRITGRENRQCKGPLAGNAQLVCETSIRPVVEETDGNGARGPV